MSNRIVDTPPPFLSGTLHLGHYYQYSLINLIRYYSTSNQEDLLVLEKGYQGFDVHGLPLELRCREIGRSKEELVPTLLEKMKADFNLLNQGLVQNTSYWNTAQKSYKEMIISAYSYLRSKDLLYLSDKGIPYCNSCRTVISKQETSIKSIVKNKYWIKGRLLDSNLQVVKDVEIMTTNPLYFSKLVVVFKNPKDERYQGSFIEVIDRKVPLLEDYSVDVTKGSGLVGSCCFSSKTDYDRIISSKICYKGIIKTPLYTEEELANLIQLKEIRRDTEILKTRVETHSERSNCNSEVSYINSTQLFLRTSQFKTYFLKEIENYNIIQEKHKNYLRDWCSNLEDWCISRQYKNGTLVKFDNLEKSMPYTCVLDCWFESALSFLKVKNYYQKSISSVLRIQGYEISRTWLLYTYVIGYYLGFDMREMRVLLTGLILNQNGKKFSKSNTNDNLSFRTIGALRLWAISFLPDKTEKRISVEEIELFEKRTEKIRRLFSDVRITEENTSCRKQILDLRSKFKTPLQGIYIEDVLKVTSYLTKEISKKQFSIINYILYPFLNNKDIS